MDNPGLLRFLESTDNPGSDIWLIGIPFDATTSFKPGARFAPDEIRKASQGLESYSPYLDKDLKDIAVYDFGNIDVSFSSPEKTINEIYEFYRETLKKEKKLCTLGGEHSITYPIIKAIVEKYKDLKLIHIDAHADMRNEYGGTPYSHASVIRRILELIDKNNYYGFGIRSGLKESFEILNKLQNFYPFGGLNKIRNIKSLIDTSSPIYITLDMDILDPAYFPGTGAPEPAGATTRELLDAIINLKGMNIVGFDIVELSPLSDPSGISQTTAAFFTRELLLITEG